MGDGKYLGSGLQALAGAIAIVVATGLTGPLASAQQAGPPVRWRTTSEVTRQLKESIGTAGYSWQGISLRAVLRSLSQSDGVRIAMLLDRRVDPSKKVNLEFSEEPLEDVLLKIAGANGIGISQVGPVIYFGPQWTTYRLRTATESVRDKLRKMPDETRKKLSAVRAWTWDNLATPRGLLEELATEGNLKIEGLEAIPHDLWARADLPSMRLVDRLGLITAAYDLTLQISPAAAADAPSIVKLIPIPEKVALVRGYPAGETPEVLANKLKGIFPDSRFVAKDDTIFVKGRAEDHAMIHDLLAGKRVTRKRVASGETRIEKLSVNQIAVGKLIEALAKKLKLQLTMDKRAIAAAGIDLEKLVSISVEKVTISELFEEITSQAGLAFELTDGKVTIRPKK